MLDIYQMHARYTGILGASNLKELPECPAVLNTVIQPGIAIDSESLDWDVKTYRCGNGSIGTTSGK